MKRQGIIYDHQWKQYSGELIIKATKVARFAYHATKILASTLIVTGLSGMLITLQPVVSSEFDYYMAKVSGQQQEEQISAEEIIVQAQENQEDERAKVRQMAETFGVPNTYFSVYIPKIGARAPIVENVNPADSVEYMNALKQGVAHASGSVFPGMDGATYLFAHSSEVPWMQSQYNTVFYLLRELEEKPKATPAPLGGTTGDEKKGDEIYIFFLDKLYKYRVTEKHTVAANDITWLTQARTGPERLILQTCWPPGTAFKRLIIVAERVE